MSNFKDIWGGFYLMVACCVLGLILAFAGGYVLDRLYGGLDDMGLIDSTNPDWTNGSWEVLGGAMNLYYFFCFLLPIIGIACFIKTIIARQGYDQHLYQ
jgi:hypothetical protein